MAHTVLMLWITGMAVILAGQNGHPAVHSRLWKSNLLCTPPDCWLFSLLRVAISAAAAAGCSPSFPRVTTFCVAAFMLGLLSFLLTPD